MLKCVSREGFFAIVCALAVSGCSTGGGSTVSPSSFVRSTASVKGQLVHAFDDGSVPMPPAPNPVLVPCMPSQSPVMDPPAIPVMDAPPPDLYYPYAIARTLSAAGRLVRTKDDGAAPCQMNMWTVGVVSSSGTFAFNPNPVMPMAGDVVVWTNNDMTTHRLVLDDGTPDGKLIGEITPGQTTMPMTLTTPLATYHCTIHPSMVGYMMIMPMGSAAPDPGAPAPPYMYDPPPDYNYGYRVGGASQNYGR